MGTSPEYLAFVLDQLAGIPGISARSMFGGSGLYCDGRMFALIADDCLYMKADAENLPGFLAESAKPFVYEGKRRPVAMSYYSVPEERIEDPELLREWAYLAIDASRRGAAKRKKKP